MPWFRLRFSGYPDGWVPGAPNGAVTANGAALTTPVSMPFPGAARRGRPGLGSLRRRGRVRTGKRWAGPVRRPVRLPAPRTRFRRPTAGACRRRNLSRKQNGISGMGMREMMSISRLNPGLFTKIDERTRVVLLTHCPIYSNSSSLRRWGEMPWVNRVLTGFRLVTTGRLKLTAATRV